MPKSSQLLSSSGPGFQWARWENVVVEDREEGRVFGFTNLRMFCSNVSGNSSLTKVISVKRTLGVPTDENEVVL